MPQSKRLFLFSVFCFLFSVLLLSGCGYVLHSKYIGEFRSIHIRNFKSQIDIAQEERERFRYRSYYPLMEIDLTNAIKDKFISDGSLKLTKEEEADLVLSGKLLDYDREPLRYSEDEEVEEYRVTLKVATDLTSKKDSHPLWKDKIFFGESSYFTTGSLATSEEDALDEAMEDLARRILEGVIERW